VNITRHTTLAELHAYFSKLKNGHRSTAAMVRTIRQSLAAAGYPCTDEEIKRVLESARLLG
jgi:hypothetical protein